MSLPCMVHVWPFRKICSEEALEQQPMASTSFDGLPKRFVKNQVGPEGEELGWFAVKKLRINQSSASNPIHVNQIEIYGCDGINHALQTNGGQARQSSMHGTGEGYGPARLVIDGNRWGRVNHTAHADDGWLEVELARPTNVESFAIFNMSDDEYDHRMRLCGHTVQLFDESGRVVYQQQITLDGDSSLFDKELKCRQLWVNEDAKPVLANLTLEKDEEEVGIPAHSLRLLLPGDRVLRLHSDTEVSLEALLSDAGKAGAEP
ncbi:ppsD [Symbiodinium necroappetens]|uniref:PpsD protein n=1 Tax=Symbiodinium necroappetens TaxID=1628268 RepID=A0A812Y408_9DINO|nr:ppsD [Symbiodinium necroappetens]